MKLLNDFKRFILISLGLIAVVVSTGCGVEYAKDSDGGFITDEKGVKEVTNTITDETTFSETWENDGWFGALLVFPLVKMITFIGNNLSSYGLAIMLSTFAVRAVVLPLTLKSTKQQKVQRELQPQVQKIRLKYSGKTDKDSQMRMQAEIQKLYKDNDINVLGGCLGPLVTMPVFFAFYSAIYRTPGIFEDTFLGFSLSTTPKFEVFEESNFLYVIPVIFVLILNFLSMKFSQNANKPAKSDVKRPYNAEAEKAPNMMEQQMKMMIYFMPIMMAFISFTLPVGISLYFMSSSLVMVIQTLIVKKV